MGGSAYGRTAAPSAEHREGATRAARLGREKDRRAKLRKKREGFRKRKG